MIILKNIILNCISIRFKLVIIFKFILNIFQISCFKQMKHFGKIFLDNQEKTT
jgi:hypothetical protein